MARQKAATQLLLQDATRTGQGPDLGNALEVQRRIGLTVLRQILGCARQVRNHQRMMTGVHRQTEIRQDNEDEPRGHETSGSVEG